MQNTEDIQVTKCWRISFLIRHITNIRDTYSFSRTITENWITNPSIYFGYISADIIYVCVYIISAEIYLILDSDLYIIPWYLGNNSTGLSWDHGSSDHKGEESGKENMTGFYRSLIVTGPSMILLVIVRGYRRRTSCRNPVNRHI